MAFTTPHGEAGSADVDAVEPYRAKLCNLIQTENWEPFQLYNADETAFYWRSLPKKTQAFRHEEATPGKKMSKEKLSALIGANATGIHKITPVIVGKAKKSRALKDHMDKLPVHYYNTKNAWFNGAIFQDWFFKHFVPQVRNYQEKVLHIPPKEVRALLLLDNAPAHPCEDVLKTDDGRITVMFLPPNTTSFIQPMDQGVIYSCKRQYQRLYLNQVLVVLEDGSDLTEDTRGLRTMANIKNYNIKDAIFNFANAWKKVTEKSISNSWNKLLKGVDPELDFEGFAPEDFVHLLNRGGENTVSVDDVEEWFDDNDADPGYQVLSCEEIAEAVLGGESSEEEEEEIVVERPKMVDVRHYIDELIKYEVLRSFRETIIRNQHDNVKQLKIDSFLQQKK